MAPSKPRTMFIASMMVAGACGGNPSATHPTDAAIADTLPRAVGIDAPPRPFSDAGIPEADRADGNDSSPRDSGPVADAADAAAVSDAVTRTDAEASVDTGSAPCFPPTEALPPCEGLPRTPESMPLADRSDALFTRSAPTLVELFFTDECWSELCENGRQTWLERRLDPSFGPLYVHADARIGGNLISDVGVAFRGASTLTSIFGGRPDAVRQCRDEGEFRHRPSFKLSFNEYERGRRFFGLNKLNLAGSEGSSPSLMSEYLFAALADELQLPAPRVNHALLCVNGVYWGVFSLVEESDGQRFLDQHFPADPDGAFYEVEAGAALTFPIDTADWYRDYYDPVAGTDDLREPMAPLIDLLAWANLTENGAFAEEAAQYLDLDEWLGMTALELVVHDRDGAWTHHKNYLLYIGAEDERARIIRFDQDFTLNADVVEWDDVEAGSRLLCYQWEPTGTRLNDDGSAPRRVGDEGHTVYTTQFPALTARLLWGTHRDAYRAHCERTWETAQAIGADFLEERLATLGPWIAGDRFMASRAVWEEHMRTFLARLEAQLEQVSEELTRPDIWDTTTRPCPIR